jgi:hypothetical protein
VPLDHDEAVRLDQQILKLADQAGQHLDYLADLLAEARAGQIHEALEFPSWTAYLADRLKPVTKALDSDDCVDGSDRDCVNRDSGDVCCLVRPLDRLVCGLSSVTMGPTETNRNTKTFQGTPSVLCE